MSSESFGRKPLAANYDEAVRGVRYHNRALGGLVATATGFGALTWHNIDNWKVIPFGTVAFVAGLLIESNMTDRSEYRSLVSQYGDGMPEPEAVKMIRSQSVPHQPTIHSGLPSLRQVDL